MVDMKKLSLIMAITALGGAVMAQAPALRMAKPAHIAQPNKQLQPETKVVPSMNNLLRTPAAPSAIQSIPGSDWATMVGYTYYDLVSYSSSNNQIYNHADGNLSVVWGFGRRGNRGGSRAGYNHYNAATSSWLWDAGLNNPGTQVDSSRYIAFNTPAFWPQILRSANKEAIASFAAFARDPGALTRAQVRQPRAGAEYGAQFTTPRASLWDTLPAQLDKEVIFHLTATDGTNSYVLTASEDVANHPNLLAGGTVNNLVIYRTTDAGTSWSNLYIDKISAANGIGGVKSSNYAIDCRGSEVAVVAQVMTARPDNGVATYLFRSSDFGATWRSKLIQKRTTADTSFRIGDNFCLATDGGYSVLIDNANKAHVTSHAGYQTLDSAGTATSTFYYGGGFANLAASGLYYFHEDMPDNADFREIAGLVDVNKNGTLTIPGSTATGRPGRYPMGGLSMSNLTQGPNGELYITYSALVEGTEISSNSRITRDIYVMASYDNGQTWTNPINVAGRLVITNGFTSDDGSTGSGLYEEVYPMVPKRIGADGKLHILFMSDDIAGLAESGTSISALRSWPIWVGNQINHISVDVTAIEASFIKANFPTQICAGGSFSINVAAPTNTLPIYGTLDNNSTYILELDTTGAISFTNPVILGTFTGNRAGGVISGTLPAGVAQGVHKIRVRVNNGNSSATPPVYESASGVYDLIVTVGTPTAPGAITNLVSTGGSIAAGGTICANTSAYFAIPSIGNAADYEWTVTPATAGAIQRNGDPSRGGNFALGTFNASATGPVTVNVVAKNGCGTSPAATFSFNIGGGTSIFDPAARTVTASASGGSWEYAGDIVGPFVPLVTPVTANVLNLNANPVNTPNNSYYRYNAGGCATNAVFVTTVGLDNNKLASQVSVYPNPASTQFSIGFKELSGAAQVEVYNATGAVVKTVSADAAAGLTTLSTRGMNKGMYFVRISTGGASTVKRLVVE